MPRTIPIWHFVPFLFKQEHSSNVLNPDRKSIENNEYVKSIQKTQYLQH
jgi:hypothetical protein